jgi:hypothetical protein
VQETIYTPEILVSEPKLLKILDFLVKHRVNLIKINDYEATQKSSTNKTHNNETTTVTSLSTSGYEKTMDEANINLNDNYLYFVYQNVEKLIQKIDYQMRVLKLYEQKKQMVFEKIKYMFYKRITEEPYENIKLSLENSQQNPKPLTNPEKVLMYNTLFTGLQLHPCLLTNLVTAENVPGVAVQNMSNILTNENFKNLVVSVFGALHNDERKENLYLRVLEKILEWEIGNNSSSEDIQFFNMNLLDSENQIYSDLEGMKRKELPYSNLLIEHVLNYDIKFRLATEEIYSRIEA